MTSLLSPISGARAGKNSITKLRTHFSIILNGIKVEIIELMDPSPKKFSSSPTNFESMPIIYFGIFFTNFLPLTFIRSKNPLCS